MSLAVYNTSEKTLATFLRTLKKIKSMDAPPLFLVMDRINPVTCFLMLVEALAFRVFGDPYLAEH